ncbi:response regulator [Marinobacter lipolyticus]|uniref:MHYT domain-containing protein n=1 Tax=Marinobacter lipolyticus TaxID=209639 RepID=UPI001BCD023B|nr:MHYT domain-containing protein [Marinobacter lipolyticus]MBS8240489.1 response regulator [Marinobacter lipolyticus]
MSLLSAFFIVSDTSPSQRVSGEYDPWLVALSLLIAVGASYMALTLASTARRSGTPFMERLHLASGAVALGFGIWSMHFIGMLAFEMPAQVSYLPGLTMLSALPSLLASWVTLSLLGRHQLTGFRLVSGGVAVGAGIGTMHYLGMAAMETGPTLRYQPGLFVLSLVVAVLLGTLALWISFGLRQKTRLRGFQRRLLAGLVMGLAIAGMHYTAMEAAQFIGTADPTLSPGDTRQTTLALVVALITVALSLMAAGVNAIARYRALFRRSEETASELQTVIDAAVDGIVKISDRGVVLSFNESAERMLGYTAAEVVGRNVSMLMPNPHRDAHDGYLKNYLRTGERKIIGSGREVWALHKDGHQFPVRLAIGESRLGGVSTFVGFLTDISERYRMETDLRQAKDAAEAAAAAKTAFLANMSHEIRTPMNAIIGFTELVLDTPLSEPQVRHLGIVRNSARSLLALLNDILDTAKLDSGRTELEIRDFSLRSVCEQILATQSLNATRKGLQLELDYRVSEFFKGDPLRIQQVVLNLVSNAVKFTNAGRVTLGVEQSTPDDVVITVADTGIGIPADRIGSIFEPFTQADSSMTRRFGGTGLGTTIARQLTELMGGQISVTSSPGEGSTFRVVLPLPAGAAVSADGNTDLETDLPPLAVLVADDVPQNLELLSTLLTQRGHSVVTASNGREALAQCETRRFDVVLMDVQMPEMNGHEATRALRHLETEHHWPPTPVIAMTASVLEEDRRAAIEAGMDGFATKPINLPELSAEIGRLLGIDVARASRPGASDNPLIDEQTVATLWPDTAEHREAAKRFLQAPENQPDTLNLDSDPDSRGAQAHRLRGVAANLGFSALASALAEMERALRQDGTVSARQWQTLLDQFQAATDWTIAGADPREAGQAAPPAAGPTTLAALDALITQLQQGEIPEQAFRRLQTALPEHCAAPAAQALDNFEPEKAAEILAVYRQTLAESEC